MKMIFLIITLIGILIYLLCECNTTNRRAFWKKKNGRWYRI